MSNQTITYLVGACLGVFGMAAFCALVLVPAVSAYQRWYERVAAVFLSMYVLAAFVGLGVLLGALIIFEWPRFF
jgi:predicted PurR-regulated permease PerM